MQKQNTVYILVDKSNGVYLGVDETQTALFTKSDPYHQAMAAPFFRDQESAMRHIEKAQLKPEETTIEATILTTSIRGSYIGAADLIKSGFGDRIGAMINNMAMISGAVH